MKRPSPLRPTLPAVAAFAVPVLALASAALATADVGASDFVRLLAQQQNRSVLDGALRGAVIGGVIIWLVRKNKGGPGGPPR